MKMFFCYGREDLRLSGLPVGPYNCDKVKHYFAYSKKGEEIPALCSVPDLHQHLISRKLNHH